MTIQKQEFAVFFAPLRLAVSVPMTVFAAFFQLFVTVTFPAVFVVAASHTITFIFGVALSICALAVFVVVALDVTARVHWETPPFVAVLVSTARHTIAGVLRETISIVTNFIPTTVDPVARVKVGIAMAVVTVLEISALVTGIVVPFQSTPVIAVTVVSGIVTVPVSITSMVVVPAPAIPTVFRGFAAPAARTTAQMTKKRTAVLDPLIMCVRIFGGSPMSNA